MNPIQDFQKKAFAQFNQFGLPSTRLEKWRYTPIEKYLSAFSIPTTPPIIQSQKNTHAFKSVETESDDVTLITIANGQLTSAQLVQSSNISVNVLNAETIGLAEKTLNSVLTNAAQSPSILSFAAANAIIVIEASAIEEERSHHLVIDHSVLGDHDQSHGIHTPIIIKLAPNAKLTVLERFEAPKIAGTDYWQNQTTLIDQAPNSHCQHIRSLNHSDSAIHIGQTYALLDQQSLYQGVRMALNGKVLRDSTQIDLRGEHARADWHAMSAGKHSDHHDQPVEVNHLAPDTHSNLLFKSIGSDNARIHCNGRIFINQKGHNADGKFYSKNLMLSPTSKVFTKPELEIYHDAVKCAHGATTSQLTPDEMRYLQSRGIPETAAKSLLIEGFLQEIIQNSWLAEDTKMLSFLDTQAFKAAGLTR